MNDDFCLIATEMEKIDAQEKQGEGTPKDTVCASSSGVNMEEMPNRRHPRDMPVFEDDDGGLTMKEEEEEEEEATKG